MASRPEFEKCETFIKAALENIERSKVIDRQLSQASANSTSRRLLKMSRNESLEQVKINLQFILKIVDNLMSKQ